MFIPIILGTGRKGRKSKMVADFILKEALKNGFKSEILDVRKYIIGITDNTKKSSKAISFKKKIEKSDALIIVSPEYNSGYPGELKLMLDMLYQEYNGKPVGFCGVSLGAFGGIKAVEQLKQVALGLKMVLVSNSLYFPKVSELFNKEGKIKDDLYYKRVFSFLEEVANYAKKLK